MKLSTFLPLLVAPLLAGPARASMPCEEAYLGVYVGDSDAGGATVTRVLEGSPAQHGGLREGDRIVSFDGRGIGAVDGLIELVADHEAGDEVRIVYVRGGQAHDVELRLGAKEEAGFESEGAAGWRVEPRADEPTDRRTDRRGADRDVWAERFEVRMNDFHASMQDRWNALHERLQAERHARHSDRLDRLAERLDAMRARFDTGHVERIERLHGERRAVHPEARRALRAPMVVRPRTDVPRAFSPEAGARNERDRLRTEVEELRAQLDRLRRRLDEIERR